MPNFLKMNKHAINNKKQPAMVLSSNNSREASREKVEFPAYEDNISPGSTSRAHDDFQNLKVKVFDFSEIMHAKMASRANRIALQSAK